MEWSHTLSLQNKYIRHTLFWTGWIFGFTFIKSIGEGMDVYTAWMVYYLITLPVFVVHTYLIVYWAAPRFLTGYRIIIFILIFFLAMVLFSFLELLITNELLGNTFPDVFSRDRLCLKPGTVIISGIGNLYILFVFAALKMIRSWVLSDQQKNAMMQRKLLIELADANAFLQPGMLLHSVSRIEELSRIDRERVPASIAMLSELLNMVMEARNDLFIRIDEEIRNVRRLTELYASLMGEMAPRLHLSGEVVPAIKLPVFIIFSPLDVLLRMCRINLPEDIYVEIKTPHHVILSWRSKCTFPNDQRVVSVELERLFPGQFSIEMASEDNDTVISIERTIGISDATAFRDIQ